MLDARIETSKTHGFAAAAQSPVARVARIVASSHDLDLELTITGQMRIPVVSDKSA